MLPIFEIMVGPCRHPNVSKASLEALLAQSGYPGVQVTTSAAPFQAV